MCWEDWMALAIMVDWYGPFGSVPAAKQWAKGAGEVLYLATGKRRYQRSTSLQYVGISNDVESRFNDPKHKIQTDIVGDLAVWIGFIVSHSVAGRRGAGSPVAHSRAVELAEWLIAYFLAMPLNIKKRARPPKDGGIVVNRWFNARADTRRVHRGHADWPDFIEYDLERDSAAVVWFGVAKRRTYSEAEIRALAKPHDRQTSGTGVR
jgi:hypothetical protein